MRILLSVFYFTIILILVACNHDKFVSSVDSKKPTSSSQDATAVFMVLGVGDYNKVTEPIKNINRWNEHPKNKGLVHIFSPPGENLTALKGHKHAVNGEQLGEEMAHVLANINANRLLIFIDAHGATNGNFCYESNNNCNLTEDPFIKLLKEQSKIRPQPIKHVLLIPLSCHNKPIMDRFNSKIGDLRSVFEISYMAMKSNTTCATDNFADNLFGNKIDTIYFIPSDHEIEQFLQLKTLQEFLAFNTNLLEAMLAKDPELLPELLYVLYASQPIKLEDFGFDIGFNVGLYFDPIKPRPFPYNKPLFETLKEFKLNQKFYKSIDSIKFDLEDDKELRIKISPNQTIISTDQRYKNLKYNGFSVIFRTPQL